MVDHDDDTDRLREQRTARFLGMTGVSPRPTGDSFPAQMQPTRMTQHPSCFAHVRLAGALLAVLGAGAVPVCAVDAGDAAVAMEQLRAANLARTALATEESAWKQERDRLHAALAATRAELARLERDATAAETARDAARTRLAALGTSSDLDAMRERLGQAGITLAARLTDLARSMPPGVIAPPEAGLTGDAAFDAAVRTLDAAERAAGTLTVEVVTGDRGGQAEAVKLLRVAGAAAWWVALDGSTAGTARVADGRLTLTACDEPGRIAIAAALAQAEGRGQPAIVLLPAPPTTGPGATP